VRFSHLLHGPQLPLEYLSLEGLEGNVSLRNGAYPSKHGPSHSREWLASERNNLSLWIICIIQ